MADGGAVVLENSKAGYNRFLLLVAGLGGLLYGVDVGIIAGALPYLEATSRSECWATFHRRRCRAAGQRDFHVVCRSCWPTGWAASR